MGPASRPLFLLPDLRFAHVDFCCGTLWRLVFFSLGVVGNHQMEDWVGKHQSCLFFKRLDSHRWCTCCLIWKFVLCGWLWDFSELFLFPLQRMGLQLGFPFRALDDWYVLVDRPSNNMQSDCYMLLLKFPHNFCFCCFSCFWVTSDCQSLPLVVVKAPTSG